MTYAHAVEPHDTNDMQDMMSNMMGGDGGMSGGMLFMGLFWLLIGALLFAVLVLAIIALVRYLRKGTADAALDALRKRYAKGKITREEFNAIKKDLEGKE